MRRTFALAAIAILPFAACSDDDEEGGGSTATTEEGSAGAGTVTVVAESVSGFDSDSYEAAAGEVTIRYENGDSAPHTLVIDGVSTDEFKLSVGDEDEGTVELEPGEYTLFCDVPGHRGAGMEATLTVE